ncbi:MAG: MATE family efflux transporter [Spirochaetae bacterium HGW-Spirochaetae-3]|jgi:putative MATE family efflux protein|nr:MAG: MATE family efflux transporter [Spirochaetae bacterium HGW-Spirochaetae-3]
MNESHKTDFLGRDAIFPLLLKMGIPAAIGMLVNALYNVVDTIFVGHGVGPLAIAALSIVFPLQMIVSAVAQALGVGTASIVSRRLGEKRADDAAAAMGTAYTAVMLITAILVATVLAFTRPILAFFGASDTIMPYALGYTRIVAAGFFFFSLSMCASNLVRSEGNAKASMVGMMMGAGLNTLLDPIFIFGFKMGVEGAAIATVLSQASSCAYLFSIYFRKKSHVPLKAADFRIKAAILREAALLGTPAFIQSAGFSILALIINNSLGHYGGDLAITTYGMNQKILTIVIMPILGIAQGFQPIAGYNYGAKHYGRVKQSLKTATLTALVVSLVGYAFMMLAPRLAIGMFTSDEALIGSSARVLRIMVLLIPFAALQITGSTYFQAIGKGTQSLLLGLSRQFILLIPIVLVLPLFIGVDGVWMAFPIADSVSTLLTATLLAREIRRLDRHIAAGA